MQSKTKKEMTNLQAVAVVAGTAIVVVFGVVLLIATTHSSNRNPSDSLFENSQTLDVMSV